MKTSKTFKAFVFTLCVMMVSAALVGCGGPASRVTDLDYPGAEVVLNGDDIYPVSCEDTLEYWTGASGSWSTRYENFGDTPLGMKIKENTGVKVEFVHPEPGQGTEQFNLMLASGELPDIVEYNWSTFQGGPDKAIEDGYIYALNDIWEVWSPAISKIMKENPEWAKDTKSDGENFYAYPFIREEDGMTVGTGLLIRHDWLKKLNSEVPETIDEWETVLTAFKEEFGCEKPLSMTADSLKNFMTAYNLWYGLYLDDGEVVYGEYQDTYRDYLAKMADWYAKGLIDPDIATVDSKAIDAGILSGQVGASAGWIGSSMGKWTTAARVAGDNEFLLAAAQFPVSKKGDKPEYGYKTRPVMMGVSAAATTNCSNVELAARLLDYGYTEEGHILFNFGIEGESFTWADKDGEKYPQYTDLILNNPDGLSITHAMGPYTRSNYNGIMIQDKRYLEQYYTQQEQVDALTLWAQVDMGKHVLPAVTILPEESDRYSEISANVSTYIEEMILKFVTGKEPIENFDKYKAQLKEFGIEEMIAMRQAAYERWKKR